MKHGQREASSLGYRAFAIAAGCLVLLIAKQNRLIFPYPWNDEARFFLPSVWFAMHGSLSPKILNAPNGIFWVPDGFYVWMGSLLALFGYSIEMARTICEATVAVGVSVFALCFRRVAQSVAIGGAATLVLVTPPVIFAANMVRMEAPIFLIISVSLLLHVQHRYLSVVSLLMLSLLFHPALTLATIAYALAVGFVWVKSSPKRARLVCSKIEWVLLAIILVAVSVEVVRVANHLSLFQAHMGYQAARKVSRHAGQLLMKPQGIILVSETAATLVMLIALNVEARNKERLLLLPIAALALGLQIYAVLGGEMAYDVYSLSLSPAIFLCITHRSYRDICTTRNPAGIRLRGFRSAGDNGLIVESE